MVSWFSLVLLQKYKSFNVYKNGPLTISQLFKDFLMSYKLILFRKKKASNTSMHKFEHTKHDPLILSILNSHFTHTQ